MGNFISEKEKKFWFGKIETKEEALKIIKDCSYGFFFIAVIIAVIWFALGWTLVWLDAILYFILGGILLIFKSRVAAISLLFLTSAALVVTFLNMINPDLGSRTGGANIFLAALLVLVSIRAIQATFKLHKLRKL